MPDETPRKGSNVGELFHNNNPPSTTQSVHCINSIQPYQVGGAHDLHGQQKNQVNPPMNRAYVGYGRQNNSLPRYKAPVVGKGRFRLLSPPAAGPNMHRSTS